MENSFQSNGVFILMAIGISVMLLVAFAFVLFFNFSQRKLHTEQLKRQQLLVEQSEKLLYNNILTQEKERKRIAKDLHDEVGSKLNVMFLNLHRLKKATPNEPAVEGIVGEIFELINQTIDTTRSISHDLLPPTLENFGLKEAIIELCDSYQKTESIDMLFELLKNEGRKTEKLVELNIFRTVQEMIKNSIKHGAAQNIGIQLWLTSENIKLVYQDDGKGFDTNDPLHRKGLGMQNIESRINMIQGKYELESTPGHGVKMTIEYQYPKRVLTTPRRFTNLFFT